MRIILYTGKGGVGKTTTACATALRLADRGTKTLLVSTDGAHSLGDALAVPVGDEPAPVADALWAVQVDTQRRLESAWREIRAYLVELITRGGVDPVTADELTVLPGADEVLALLAVLDFAARGDWDVLVVDCAPTAETLRLLALPEALGWYLNKLFPAQQRLSRGARPLLALLGRGTPVPPEGVFAALLRLADELAALRALLCDPAVTSVRLVLTPERLVVAEARRAYTALALYGFAVDGVVANREIPAGGDPWRAGWAAAQEHALADVAAGFAGVGVLHVPYRPGEPVGADALRAVGDDLYGPLPGADPVSGSAPLEPPDVRADGTGFVLHLRLPLAERSQVHVARVADDLVLTVAGHRRVLALPSVLRRCVVVSGRFAEDELRVRFEPDPALWPDLADRASRPGTAR